MKKFITFILIFLFSHSIVFSQEKRMSKSEPVPGAEITVEQVPGPIVIKTCITDKNGEFTLTFPKGYKFPSSGELILTITPPKTSGAKDKEQLNGSEIGGRKYPTTKQKITVKFKTEKGMIDAWCTANLGPYSHAHSNMEDEQKGTKGTTLKFVLIWNPPDPVKSNKGGFAVSGKNMS
jgi:hypothetical protein